MKNNPNKNGTTYIVRFTHIAIPTSFFEVCVLLELVCINFVHRWCTCAVGVGSKLLQGGSTYSESLCWIMSIVEF